MLIFGMLPWLVTISAYGINCADPPSPEPGLCRANGIMFALLIAVQAPTVLGWMIARARGDRRWFTVSVSLALGVNVLVAILTVMWSSGDL